MADDWDLFAVVRSCTNSTATSTATATVVAPPPPIATSSISNPARVSRNRGDPFVNLLPPFQNDGVDPFYFPGVIDERDDHSFQGLEEIYKELYLDSAVPGPSGEFQNSHQQQQVQPRVLQPPPPPPPQQQNQHSPINRRGILGSSFPSTNPHSVARPRRRKNQHAKVTHHMTQEELSTDSWAWRKYGQKPIKGSPYPRNYYRCSTSKSCSARKQVERSPTDPDIFVVSYSGEHTHPRPTHRSSLAGSTRSKLPTTKPPTNIASTLITTSSSPVSPTSFSPAATPIVMEEEEGDSEGNQENINRGDNDDNDNNNIEEDEEEEEEEEEEEDILIPNNFITDDILKGFEELNGGAGASGGGNIVGGSDSVTDNSSACGLISPPWTPTTNFAAAGGGC